MSGYENYTLSPVPWIKQMPGHWGLVRGKNLYQKMQRPTSDTDEVVTCFRDGTVTLRKNRRTTGFTESLKEIGYQGIRKGDLVIHVMDAFAGSIGVSDSDGKGTPVYSVCQAKGNSNNQYYALLLREMARSGYIQSLYRGIRERSSDFRFEVFAAQFYPVPPREEQDQIVRFLDWKVSSINKLINIKHKEISELNESLNTKLRDVLLSVPNVKEVPLKRICSVPMTDGPHETPTFVDSGIPFVSAEASHDGRIHLDECRGFITREQHEVYCQKVRPHKNDIFIVKSGSTTGKTVMVDFDEEFSIWSPLALVRCNNLAMPRYVFFYCTSVMFQKQVRDNWSFGTQPNIGMGVLENLRLPLPEIEEQRAIADTLDAYWSKVLQVKCNLKKQIEEFQSLKTRIIADAVTGKIDVRSIEIPEYEFVDEDNDNVDENLEQGADEPPEEE